MGAIKAKRIFLSTFLFWVIVNLALAYPACRSYQEKQQLCALGLGEDPGESIARYLKEGPFFDGEDEKEPLRELGYTDTYVGTLQKQLFFQIFWNALTTGLAGAGLLFLYMYDRNKRRNETEASVQWICDRLAGLKNSMHTGGSCGDSDTLPEDMPQLVRIEEELAQLSDRIGQVYTSARADREETKALVTDISHQLRTPLTALWTSFELLCSGSLSPDEYAEFQNRCAVQMVRLQELTDALLQISRLETGLIELKLQRTPLFDTILTAVNRIYPRAREKEIAVVLEETDAQSAPLMVLHDPRWLSEALINILENAVKYSPDSTQVTITVLQMAVSVRIEIIDQGIGILPEDVNRIFRRFWRGDNARIREENGQGIGLYLARQIIEKHHGTIRVAAQKPQGSRFVIQLPLG
ncbi:sensor histidine kinase [Parablautia sp. Marseille-Q6255]|uniref:sensor histidine kinase n=1 Tax=Parablautia sp. Marseille-Q6255 TaxID=3039593 RepID=UPI0024BC1F0F|nr:HAMP domain-containing sensor histidine kinase [Parablautia sp. Marseille-Q6255]